MAITRDKFFTYTMLPGVLPRVRALWGSGFSFIAGLMAVLYSNVGLLPAGHPYLNPSNIGRFTVFGVLTEAGRNLVFSRKHADQVALYFLMLAAVILLLVQIVLVGISFFFVPAFAMTFDTVFNTPTNTDYSTLQDLAFVTLDAVFGMREGTGGGSTVGFFNSCYSNTTVDCLNLQGRVVDSPTTYPSPFHLGLHALLHFYSVGIAFVAGLVIIYFIISIVGETVTSGTPFGKRLNRAWFIPRLIVFFALIAPISTTGNNAGINGAQLIVLSTAKFGSNLATNIWLGFIDDGSGAIKDYLGQDMNMVAMPTIPEVGVLSQFMHVVRTCIYAEKVINGVDVLPYLVREPALSDISKQVIDHTGSTSLYAFMGGPLNFRLYNLVDYEDAMIFARYKTIIVRFGHYNPPGGLSPGTLGYRNFPESAADGHYAYVEPTCGELHIRPTSTDQFVLSANAGRPGIEENYYDAINDYLYNDDFISDTSYCMVQATLPYDHRNGCIGDTVNYPTRPNPTFATGANVTSPTQWLTAASARGNIDYYNNSNKFFIGVPVNPNIFQDVEAALTTVAYQKNFLYPPELRQRGWAAAALWYNKIADLNGLIVSAVNNVPQPYKYPQVMEYVAAQHKTNDSNASHEDRFNPRLQNGKLVDFPRAGDNYLAAVMYNSYSFWDKASVNETVRTSEKGHAVIDIINTLMGTQGLFDMSYNGGNQNVHPLAKLSSLGKGMVDAAVNNIFGGVVGQGLGAILGDNFFGKLAETAGAFSFRMAMVGLSIGFILYYVLPILPFLYFFFAFGGWIKSIFEAVVAMPLWAIAHIRIDGQGLPGPLATNGYFLLFEILLRPTLIIVGLLSSILLFSALVYELSFIFTFLTFTAGGLGEEDALTFTGVTFIGGTSVMDYWRGPVDTFFHTAIFTIIVYMLALSSFKLIDAIPNNIMRWMGVTVSTFQETAGDPAKEITGKMFRSTQMANAQVMNIINKSTSATDQQGILNVGGAYK